MDAEYFYANVGIEEGLEGDNAEYIYANLGITDGLTAHNAEYLYSKLIDISSGQHLGFIVCDIWYGDGSRSPMILG